VQDESISGSQAAGVQHGLASIGHIIMASEHQGVTNYANAMLAG